MVDSYFSVVWFYRGQVKDSYVRCGWPPQFSSRTYSPLALSGLYEFKALVKTEIYLVGISRGLEGKAL